MLSLSSKQQSLHSPHPAPGHSTFTLCVTVATMSHSPAPEDAHLATITKQILDLMGSLNTFTYMSVTALLNLDTKCHRRLYNVLCALEGIGLLSKDRKLYTWKRQWYQLPIFKDNSMSRHIGTVYCYVRCLSL